jgi:hypothetical protein
MECRLSTVDTLSVLPETLSLQEYQKVLAHRPPALNLNARVVWAVDSLQRTLSKESLSFLAGCRLTESLHHTQSFNWPPTEEANEGSLVNFMVGRCWLVVCVWVLGELSSFKTKKWFRKADVVKQP